MTSDESESEVVSLEVPRAVYRKLERVIEGSDFQSVAAFANHVLADLASNPETRRELAPGQPLDEQTEPLTPEDIDEIRERLQSLGYL